MNTKSLLQVHSRSICLLTALVIAAILSFHVASAPVLPIADGEGYAMRAFALYGYLHTGQWDNFGKLLVRPGQSIFPLHYALFLILPKSLAGPASYVVVQNVTTYLLLAYAVFKVAQILNRPEWAPAIFLLCSVNNIALTDFYAFFLDMPFLSVGLLVIAWQMKSWNESRVAISILCGVGLGLLFFVKPANALIFLATYGLSEIFHAASALHSVETKTGRRHCLLNLFRDWGCKMLGFIPLLLAAFLCGGVQTILQLIDQNEIHELNTPVDCGGLLRLFYFPLCLSACYQVLLLGGLLLFAFLSSLWIPVARRNEAPPLFPIHLFITVVISYLILGEFFSFWMIVKPVRSLLLMLPLFGFVFCWWWEKRRLRIEPVLLVAMTYASLAFSQKAFNIVGSRDQLVEDTYQLTWSSWTEMPSAWHRGPSLNQRICDSVSRDLPPTGVICVNSIEIRNSLAWRLRNGALLLGQTPSYEVRNLFDYKGKYYDQALVGANRVVLITFFPVQSSRSAWLESMGILDYGNEEWCGKALARVSEMPSIREEPIGYQFIFEHPLAQADVDRANQSAPFAGASRAESNPGADSPYGRCYSQAEGWKLLQTWFNKRFN